MTGSCYVSTTKLHVPLYIQQECSFLLSPLHGHETLLCSLEQAACRITHLKCVSDCGHRRQKNFKYVQKLK